jgi:hypothetical protein
MNAKSYVPDGGFEAIMERGGDHCDVSDAQVAALLAALKDSTEMLRMSDGIAEDGQALRNTELIEVIGPIERADVTR